MSKMGKQPWPRSVFDEVPEVEVQCFIWKAKKNEVAQKPMDFFWVFFSLQENVLIQKEIDLF